MHTCQMFVLGVCALSQVTYVAAASYEQRNNDDGMGFRLTTIDDELERCSRDGDILMDSYLTAYQEILKIFKQMGTLFNFVTNDLEDKIRILEEYRSRSDVAEHFASLSRMISYELSNGAIKVRQPPSGSRTWLRLHRALQFSALFFTRLANMDFDEKMTSLAQDCYEETLARHHSFLVRKGASLAMYALPTADVMFSKAVDGKKNLRGLLRSIGVNANRVYDLTQQKFEQEGLLDLP